MNTVKDQARRWTPAAALLGTALVHTKTGTKTALTVSQGAPG